MFYNIKNKNYKDFKVINQNRLLPRSYFIPFSNSKKCIGVHPIDAAKKSDRVIMLNGEWDFAFYSNGGKMPNKIDTKNIDFEKIKVPSSIGFEKPYYVKERYLFNCKPPIVPTRKSVGIYKDGLNKKLIKAFDTHNSAAIYRKKVDINDINKTYILSFFGVASCFDLYINGNYVGYSEGSFETAEFEISKFLHAGFNEILVVVHKWCNGSYLESHNMFRLNGIFRDVMLFANNNAYVYDFEVKTTPLFNKGEYRTDLAIKVRNGEGCSLRVAVKGEEGEKFNQTVRVNDETVEMSFEDYFSEYNAEKPILYKLYISLIKDNIVTECICKNIGYKEVKIKDGIFYYNDKPIKIKGVNYKETNPEKGYYITYEQMQRDIELMKDYNINAVRIIVPPHPIFVELCVLAGLYVIAEPDINTQGTRYSPFWRPNLISKKKKWINHYIDRMERLYNSLKNQVSVIMWSLGNKSGGLTCQDACYGYLKSVSSLPVFYNDAVNTKKLCYDVLAFDSCNLKELSEVQEKGYKGHKINKPVFLCKYAAAKGVGPGCLEEYNEFFNFYENFMGGCVWEFCDSAIKKDKGKYKYTFGGDYEEFIHSDSSCLDGLFSPERKPHTGAMNLKYVYRPIKAKLIDNNTLELYNTQFFSDTSNLRADLSVYKNGVKKSRTELDINIEARQKRQFDVFLGHIEEDMYLNIKYVDIDTNREIAKEQLPINEELISIDVPEGENLSVNELPDFLKINFENGFIRIDKEKGCLVNYVFDGKELLKAEPSKNGSHCFTTNILRAFTDIERPAKGGTEIINVILKEFSYKIKCDDKGRENKVEVHFNSAFYIEDKESYISQDMFVIYASGKMEVYTTLHPRRKNLPELKCFGKVIKMPLQYNSVMYYGRGEGENYPDIKNHAPVGTYNLKAQDFSHEYIRPQESGNRCDTRYAIIKNDEGRGFMFYALAKPFNLKINMYPKWKIDNAKHREDLGVSDGIYVHIDNQIKGVGADNYDTLTKYKISNKDSYVMGFTVIPFSQKKEF